MEQKGGQSIAVSVEYAARTLTENSQLYWKCEKHIAYYTMSWHKTYTSTAGDVG